VLIDLDDPTTWPPELRAIAERLWADARSSIDPDGGMDQLRELIQSDEIDEALIGHELLVFHATRLLPHENELVLRDGIQPASEGWQRERLRLASGHHPGLLDETVIEQIVDHGPLRWQGTRGRAGLVHFVHARSTVVEHARDYDRLFIAWGGEIIYWQDTTPDDARTAALRELTAASVPTLVVGRLPAESIQNVYGWAATIVGTHGRLHGAPATWTEGGLPVEQIIQPGDHSWDDRWLA
jgi:hypothetical protein